MSPKTVSIDNESNKEIEITSSDGVLNEVSTLDDEMVISVGGWEVEVFAEGEEDPASVYFEGDPNVTYVIKDAWSGTVELRFFANSELTTEKDVTGTIEIVSITHNGITYIAS